VPFRFLAKQHYGIQKDRPFFHGLVEFITFGPAVGMVWGGDGVIAGSRKSTSATMALESDPGTIHCDLAVNIGRNVIHGSDVSE